MKHATFCLFSLLILYNSQCKFLDITDYGGEQYQDIIIDNVVVKPASGTRHDCTTRYELIKSVLDTFNRPFTMIDLGAAQGYYSFRTAYDYNSVCVMVEGNNPHYKLIGDQLLDLCKANNLANIILLQKSLVIGDILQLGKCEHFDVVLALNIIHWFYEEWKSMTDAILSLGDNIIIETPPVESRTSKRNTKIRKQIENYLIEQGAIIIGKVKRHTSDTYSNMYLIKKRKQKLQCRTLIHTQPNTNQHFIQSDTESKKLIKITQKGTRIVSEWQQGINLITFKMYHGAYPLYIDLSNALANIRDRSHPDWMPNNMILQGKTITLIDYDGKTLLKYTQNREDAILEWLKLKNPQAVKETLFSKIMKAH